MRTASRGAAFLLLAVSGAVAQSNPVILQGTQTYTGNYYGCNATATVTATYYSAYPASLIGSWSDVFNQGTGIGGFSGTLSYNIPCKNLSGSTAIQGNWQFVGGGYNEFEVQWSGGFSYTVSDAFTQSLPPTWLVSNANATLSGVTGNYSDSNSTLSLNLSANGGSPPTVVPTITSLSPSSVTAGGAAFTLTVNGSNFGSDATVQWNGTNLPSPKIVSSSQLTVSVGASLIASAGTESVTVTSGGQTSTGAALTIAPSAQIPDCNHRVVGAGGVLSPCLGPIGIGGGIDQTLTSVTLFEGQQASVTLGAGGTNPPFVYSIIVGSIPGGFQQTTVPAGNSNLTELILTGTPAAQGTFTFTVKVVDANGNSYSEDLSIIVIGPLAGSGPTISSLSPSSATAAGGAFTLTINGTNFASGASVQWNGATLPNTNFISSTQLTATVSAALIASAGTAAITVSSGGQTSTGATFTITSSGGSKPSVVSDYTSTTNGIASGSCTPPPAVTSFTTASPQVWLYLSVTGAAATDAVVIQWVQPNGVTYQTNTTAAGFNNSVCFAYYINVSGAAPASDPGTWTIRVLWNGSSLFSVNFAIQSASTPSPPAITSLSPSSAPAGGPSVAVTITGTGFVSGAVAQWNGLSLTTSYINATTVTAQITAADLISPGSGQVTVINPTGPASNSLPFIVSSGSALQFLTVAPCRVMDTRNPNGQLGGPFIGAGTPRAIPVLSSACGIPANAAAYSLNFTVVPRTGSLSYLSVWSAGQAQPLVSTLNSPNGSILANAAIVPAGTSGAIEAYASNDTDLVVDINGYFIPPAANTLQFHPLTPCRVLDTRNPTGNFGGPSIASNSSRSFPIQASPCGVPASATAYALNVTVVPQGELEYLTAWPTGQTQPYVSTLNSFGGTILANAAIVAAGAGGAVSFYASNTTNLVVDINGYFAPPVAGGLNFYPAAPCRLVDTRTASGPLGGPTMSAGTTRAFPLSQGSCGLPGYPMAQAYSLNITVVPQGVLSYLTTWQGGAAQPGVSTLNALTAQIVANAAIVPAGANGSIEVYVTNTTGVVIDTNGYFGP